MNFADDPSLKRYALTGFFAVGVLFVLSMIFYREKAFFADCSFALFNIINNKSFFFVHERYGIFIVEILSYLEQKMHCPVSLIAFSYVASFYAFSLAVIATLIFGFRQYRLAILLSLYYFVLTSESFLFMSESTVGVAWLFLLLGMTLYGGKRKINAIWLSLPFAILSFCALSSHFTIFIPTIFLWIYLINNKDYWHYGRRATVLFSCVLLLVGASKFLYTIVNKDSSYDNSNLQGVTHISLKSLLKSFSEPVVREFLLRCITNYWVTFILFFIGIMSAYKHKKFFLAYWSILFVSGYFILIGISFSGIQNFILFHVEYEWMCLGIILAAPFVFSNAFNQWPQKASILLIFVFVIRTAYICYFIPEYHNRLQASTDILNRMHEKRMSKLALYRGQPPFKNSMLEYDWGLSFSTPMLSSMLGYSPQMNVFFVNQTDPVQCMALQNTKGLYMVWGEIPVGLLNPFYFHIDSTHGYQVMSYDDFIR